MKTISPYQLKGTLYVPGTKDGIFEIISGEKYSGLGSVVLDLEDSININDTNIALKNIKKSLKKREASNKENENSPLIFIRPRNPILAKKISTDPEFNGIHGMVIPKLNLENMQEWGNNLKNNNLYLMPTIETDIAFDPSKLIRFCNELPIIFQNNPILAIRIGANDLLSLLGQRRNFHKTIYCSPLSYTIPMITGILCSKGFSVTAPVCENIVDTELLKNELEIDIDNGMIGKTIIHPNQINIVNESFKIKKSDVETAQIILDKNAPAVFKHDGSMQEIATHKAWAERTIERSIWHGIK